MLAQMCDQHTIRAAEGHLQIVVDKGLVDDWTALEARKVPSGWRLYTPAGWEVWEWTPYPGPEDLPDIFVPVRFTTRAQAKAYAITMQHRQTTSTNEEG